MPPAASAAYSPSAVWAAIILVDRHMPAGRDPRQAKHSKADGHREPWPGEVRYTLAEVAKLGIRGIMPIAFYEVSRPMIQFVARGGGFYCSSSSITT